MKSEVNANEARSQ